MFTDDSIVSIFLIENEIVGMGRFCRSNYSIKRCIRFPVFDIFENRTIEKKCLLQYHTQLAPEFLQTDILNRMTIDQYRSGIDIEKTADKVNDGAFTCTRFPDQTYHFSRSEIHTFYHFLSTFITKPDIAESDCPFYLRKCYGTGRFVYLAWGVEYTENSFCTCKRMGHPV